MSLEESHFLLLSKVSLLNKSVEKCSEWEICLLHPDRAMIKLHYWNVIPEMP